MGSKQDMISQNELKDLRDIQVQMADLVARLKGVLDKCELAPSTASTDPRPAEKATAGSPKVEVPEPGLKSEVPAAKKEEAQPADNKKVTTRDRIVGILKDSDGPMSFEEIYAKLETNGALPKSKPMLVVRKILFDTQVFAVDKGRYFLAD